MGSTSLEPMDSILTLDQLIRRRATDADQTPLIAYPASRQGVEDYEPINGKALDRFVDGAVMALAEEGFTTSQGAVVGICAPCDLDYIVTIFGLLRLGYVPFLLSPRLALSAIADLLAQQASETLFYSSNCQSFNVDSQSFQSLRLLPVLCRNRYDGPRDLPQAENRPSGVDRVVQPTQCCLMLHSSGSTGLPKPIGVTNQALMLTGAYAQDATTLLTAPISHSFGFLSLVQAIHTRKTMYAMSGHVPQTFDTVADAILAAKPDIIWTVPYILTLIADKLREVPGNASNQKTKNLKRVMKDCRFVSSAGSRLPDKVAKALMEAGVHIGMQFGSTETGLILSSAYRPREDRAWDYLRPLPHVAPYLTMLPTGDGTFECIILDGHKAKLYSNSNDPPGSWHTHDLFLPHDTVPNAWKFVGRMDDRINLANGEKILPLPMENRIRQNPLIREAVLFGVDRQVPGLLLFRAPNTSHFTDQEFVDQVWSTVLDANSRAEAFAQISREMVAVMPENSDIPVTDKNSIKRKQIYRDFAKVIDGVYTKLESRNDSGVQQLPRHELEDWILQIVRSLGCAVRDAKTEFFSAGMDSLKATQLRGRILKHIDLGAQGPQCSQMIALEMGNAENLAKCLFEMQTTTIHNEESQHSMMKDLVERYSDFAKDVTIAPPGNPCDQQAGSIVLLTGATGFVGAHILASLVEQPSVAKVYCLLRPGPGRLGPPQAHLQASLQDKGIKVALNKVVVISTSIENPDLGLPTAISTGLREEITHVIHCAWPVNFVLPLAAFEPQIQTLSNLLRLCLQAKKRAHLLFCSSIGIAQNIKATMPIDSAPLSAPNLVPTTGYAQSKLVAERIIEAGTLQGIHATILRIGQVAPGLSRGTNKWNPTEAIPLMVRSMSNESAGALPLFEPENDTCHWLPVDILANTILELAEIGKPLAETKPPRLVYNLVNPRGFSWNRDLLPAIQNARLDFNVVPWTEWLQRLEASTDNPQVNPSRKLLEFWKRKKATELLFNTDAAQAASPTFRGLTGGKDGVDGMLLAHFARSLTIKTNEVMSRKTTS